MVTTASVHFVLTEQLGDFVDVDFEAFDVMYPSFEMMVADFLRSFWIGIAQELGYKVAGSFQWQ